MSLTPEGFERARLPEIKADYDQRLADALGPVNTNPDAILGQIQGIWAEGIDNINEALQDTYDAMYPFSAEGTSLDGAVAFVGLTRIPATATVVTGVAYGTEGTLIPSGVLAHVDIQYFSTSDVIISRANALDVIIEVVTVANSTAYNVFAGGVSATFTTGVAATKGQIVAGLAALLNTGQFTAVVAGETLRLFSKDGVTPFAITVDAKLNITKRGSPVVFVASAVGARVVPVGALNSIDTPVSGWDSLSNLAAGVTGRNTETDTELRARHAISIRGTGSATVEAIKSRMLADVPEVTSISIYENRTSITDSGGIPPHAFESVISGGSDSDIREQLWLTKPAGIETYGNVSGSITDSQGDSQIVKFSRPVTKFGWLNISAAIYPEETLPTAAITSIKKAAVDYANSNIGVGTDIIIQRFFGPIYAAVDGLGSLTITAAITTLVTDTPSFGSSNIPMGRAEIAVFSEDRINVTGI